MWGDTDNFGSVESLFQRLCQGKEGGKHQGVGEEGECLMAGQSGRGQSQGDTS